MDRLNKKVFWFAVVVCSAYFTTAEAQEDLRIYGYSSLYFEKVGKLSNAPAGTESNPGEFDYANLNIMMQSNISDKVRGFVNLAGTDNIEVRNYWGEYIVNDKLKIRSGKIYRRFGQFNELLDAIPTYLGMEPPELYDGDHLMLPRTGKLMIHGGTSVGDNFLNYSYMLDSDENLLASNNDELTLSHTYDFNMTLLDYRLTVGHSGFFANEANGPSVGVGEGPPSAGVLPWMDSDKYNVFSAYFTARFDQLIVKGAYFTSNHNVRRNPDAVATVYQNTNLNASQVANFYGSNYSGNYSAADVIVNDEYVVSAYYLRLGYRIPRNQIPGKISDVTPYFLIDGYSNPETIASKSWGGDNEAGVADDGKFFKPTFGFVFHVSPHVVFKIDASSHYQKINGNTEHYNEIRMDFSFMF